jgi:hypothetical protein
MSPLTKLVPPKCTDFLKKTSEFLTGDFFLAAPNGSRMVPDGPPMLWGHSGITRDVSAALMMPRDVCVKAGECVMAMSSGGA